MRVILEKVEDDSYYELKELIRSDEDLKDFFYWNFHTRLGLASIAYYIVVNYKRVGFIALVEEAKSYNIDTGIIEEYRSLGIGSKALKMFLETIKSTDKKIVVETKVENLKANKSLLKNNFKLIKTQNDINYYGLGNKSIVKLKK